MIWEVFKMKISVLQVLEQKIFSLQEELTDLHKKRSENASHVLSLSAKLTDKETELSTAQTQLASSVAKCADLEDQITFLQSKIQEYVFWLEDFIM